MLVGIETMTYLSPFHLCLGSGVNIILVIILVLDYHIFNGSKFFIILVLEWHIQWVKVFIINLFSSFLELCFNLIVRVVSLYTGFALVGDNSWFRSPQAKVDKITCSWMNKRETNLSITLFHQPLLQNLGLISLIYAYNPNS